jgi:hypothetical protein
LDGSPGTVQVVTVQVVTVQVVTVQVVTVQVVTGRQAGQECPQVGWRRRQPNRPDGPSVRF